MHCRIWCSELVVLAVVVWGWDASCVHCGSFIIRMYACMFVKLRHLVRDGCICYIERCLVVYCVSESDFVRRAFAYLCLRVINTCEW